MPRNKIPLSEVWYDEERGELSAKLAYPIPETVDLAFVNLETGERYECIRPTDEDARAKVPGWSGYCMASG